MYEKYKIKNNIDPLTVNQKVEVMWNYTDTYKNNKSSHKSIREAMCIAAQNPHIMSPIIKGDLFAGRVYSLPIGFSPQEFGSVGFYASIPYLEYLKHDKNVSCDNLDKLDCLIKYWKTETTDQKIYDRYPDSLKKYLTHEDFQTNSGIAFPLYRMGGAQMDFDKLVRLGITGLKNEVRENHFKNPSLFDGMNIVLDVISKVCIFYKEQALEMSLSESNMKYKKELQIMADCLEGITQRAPQSFREAIQLVNIYVMVSGAQNYGRMDEYFGDLYVNDIDSGRITQEEAIDLLCNFWLILNANRYATDCRVICGGKGRRNEKNADRLATEIMEASRRVKGIVPQLTLRFYEGQDINLYQKALQLIGDGTTFPILYNDDINIPSVMNAFNLPESEAVNYLPFGCGEYIINHRSFGTPSGAINLLQALIVTLNRGYDPISQKQQGIDFGDISGFDSFEKLWEAFKKQVEFFIELLANQQKIEYEVCNEEAAFLLFSLLFDDCIDRGKALLDGGIRYLGGTLESYGNTNTADSLTAIKKIIFDEKDITLAELSEALKADFVGHEDIQQMLLSASKYGNDDDEADSMAVSLHKFVCKTTAKQAEMVGLDSYLTVVINNSMNTIFGNNTATSPDGRKARAFMANANNPVGGMDRNGITALLNSLVKLDTDIHAGVVQNIKFSKDMFGKYLDKTMAILKTYFESGGAQAMITVLNRDDLENAVKEPEKYANLIVRVGGFSARFVTLPTEVQQEIISRTLY